MGPLLSVCCRVTLTGSCVGRDPFFLGSTAVRGMVPKECCQSKRIAGQGLEEVCASRPSPANMSFGCMSSRQYMRASSETSMPCTDCGGNTTTSPALTGNLCPSQKPSPCPAAETSPRIEEPAGRSLLMLISAESPAVDQETACRCSTPAQHRCSQFSIPGKRWHRHCAARPDLQG